jgi:Tol biopolymer transport system component
VQPQRSHCARLWPATSWVAALAIVTPVGCGQAKGGALASSDTTNRAATPTGTIAAANRDLRTIFLIAASTGRETRVRSPALILDSRVDLSNDGSEIAVAAQSAIWVFNRRGANAHRVVRVSEDAPELADVAWSPDGRKLVFARGDSLFTVDATGKHLKRLFGGPASEPDWSPTGDRIIFVRGTGSGAGVIFSIKTDGSDVRRILRGDDPDVSPDGSKITFARRDGVYVVPVAGGKPRRITRNAKHPEWSPDGTSLAFTRTSRVCDEGGCRGRVLIVRATGGRARPIGPGIFEIGPLSWSR